MRRMGLPCRSKLLSNGHGLAVKEIVLAPEAPGTDESVNLGNIETNHSGTILALHQLPVEYWSYPHGLHFSRAK